MDKGIYEEIAFMLNNRTITGTTEETAGIAIFKEDLNKSLQNKLATKRTSVERKRSLRDYAAAFGGLARLALDKSDHLSAVELKVCEINCLEQFISSEYTPSMGLSCDLGESYSTLSNIYYKLKRDDTPALVASFVHFNDVFRDIRNVKFEFNADSFERVSHYLTDGKKKDWWKCKGETIGYLKSIVTDDHAAEILCKRVASLSCARISTVLDELHAIQNGRLYVPNVFFGKKVSYLNK